MKYYKQTTSSFQILCSLYFSRTSDLLLPLQSLQELISNTSVKDLKATHLSVSHPTMRHLALSFLFLSVNSFSQDLRGRFSEDYSLANGDPENGDFSLFDNPISADKSSDLFGSTIAMADGLDPINTDFLGESSAFGDLDGVGTFPSLLDAAPVIANTPEHPRQPVDANCPDGTYLACCFMGRLTECIWYSQTDPGCYYDDGLRCCESITGIVGEGCRLPLGAQQQENPIEDAIRGVLEYEIPTGWLAPLGDAAGAILDGI